MAQRQRLRGKSRFQAVFSQGRTWTSHLIVLKGLRNGLEYNRYGFAVGKRLGKAVLRNRIKRRLRECVRQVPLQTGWDLVIVARGDIASVDYQVIKESLRVLANKARLLGETS